MLNKYFDNKKMFLNKFKGESLRVNSSNFKKFSIIEEEIGKDLASFSRMEFEYFFKKLEITSLASLQNIVIKISNYIEFERLHGDKVDRLSTHPIQEFKVGSYLETFLKDDDLVVSRKELYSIAKLCDNLQDSLTLILLFEGVSHRNDMEELRDIKIDDVDLVNNRIFLQERNLFLDLPSEAMIIIEKSLNDIYYYSVTGFESRKYTLKNTGYLLRGIRGNGKISARNLNQRIARVSERFGYNLTPTTISNSGQLDYLMILDEEHTSLDVFEKSLCRYGMSINESSRHYLKIRWNRYKVNKEKKDEREGLMNLLETI